MARAEGQLLRGSSPGWTPTLAFGPWPPKLCDTGWAAYLPQTSIFLICERKKALLTLLDFFFF